MRLAIIHKLLKLAAFHLLLTITLFCYEKAMALARCFQNVCIAVQRAAEREIQQDR